MRPARRPIRPAAIRPIIAGVPGAPDFDLLEDDEGPPTRNSTALPPPGPVLSPDDPRYGRPMGPPVYSDRAPPPGPVLSPDDPRYGRPMGAPPAYSDRGPPTPPGPILSPDDPRYGRPDGPPPVIYSDRPGAPPRELYSDRGDNRVPGYNYPDDGNRALRPPGAIAAPNGVTGSVQQPPTGPDGRPMVLSALPPDEQPEVAPAQLAPNLRRQEVAFPHQGAGGNVDRRYAAHLSLLCARRRTCDPLRRPRRPRRLYLDRRAEISRKAEWPDWHPPTEMIERQPYLPRFMAGGPGNPLGARAMYLGATVYRIHGTNQPSTIGKFVSSGCIGMLNDDVSDLFDRVKVGTRVVVLPGGAPPPSTRKRLQRSRCPDPNAAPQLPPPNVPGAQPSVVPPLPAPVIVR